MAIDLRGVSSANDLPLPKKRSSGPTFSRPGISIFKHGREWKTVSAADLQPGDIIAARGVVEEVSLSGNFHVTVKLPEGETTFLIEEPVRAFVLS